MAYEWALAYLLDFLKMLCILQVSLLMLYHLYHLYKKNINYYVYFPVMAASYN